MNNKKFKVVKTTLNNCFNDNDNNKNIIEKMCSNVTTLDIQIDMFSRLYILSLNNKNIPIIDFNFYKMVSIVLMQKK